MKFLKIKLFNIFQSKLKHSKCFTLQIISAKCFRNVSFKRKDKADPGGRADYAGIAGSNPAGGAWIPVSCECCVLPVRGLCEGSISRPEEAYRVWICH
jgi:hypothetical protein